MLFAFAGSFALLLAAVALIGMGSSVFHPESSRVAHMAAGGQQGLAQSVFQVGGHAGSSLGPLAAALILTGRGQGRLAWFVLVPLLAMPDSGPGGPLVRAPRPAGRRRGRRHRGPATRRGCPGGRSWSPWPS